MEIGEMPVESEAPVTRAPTAPAVDPVHIATRLRAQRLCRPGRCAAFALG